MPTFHQCRHTLTLAECRRTLTYVLPDSSYINARSLPRLGSAISGLRKQRGWTQAELARRAGVSRQWLNAVENGRTAGLEVGKLMICLDVLDASLVIRDDSAGAH